MYRETSVPALGIGIIYLLAKKVINMRIPFSYILSFALALSVYLAASGQKMQYIVFRQIYTEEDLY